MSVKLKQAKSEILDKLPEGQGFLLYGISLIKSAPQDDGSNAYEEGHKEHHWKIDPNRMVRVSQ